MHTPDMPVEEFIGWCRELASTCDELQIAGSDDAAAFAESVGSRLLSMADWAADHNLFTVNQFHAVENMQRGISKWQERE